MKFLASPNFNERQNGDSIEYVIIHYTGMSSTAKSIERLRNPAAEVSAHYVIKEDGSIVQLVDEKLRAWHAGASLWHGRDDLNSRSIGIELANLGHDLGYPDFPEEQLTSLECLLSELFKRYKLAPSALLAHSDVAPTRKQDPGEKFPWEVFAKLGFGLWPEAIHEDNGKCATALLTKAGYDCADERAALTAFQRRYCPSELGQEETKETMARLRGLVKVLS